MKTNFKNINEIINCNSIEMLDGSKWIEWYLKNKKEVPQKNLDAIVHILNGTTGFMAN